MKYQITLMTKDKIWITEDEYQKILIAPKGLNRLTDGRVINTSVIALIQPEDQIDTSSINEGFLHDGTPVVRVFGVWCLKSNPDVKIDGKYYPEVLKDAVFASNPKLIEEDVPKIAL